MLLYQGLIPNFQNLFHALSYFFTPSTPVPPLFLLELQMDRPLRLRFSQCFVQRQLFILLLDGSIHQSQFCCHWCHSCHSFLSKSVYLQLLKNRIDTWLLALMFSLSLICFQVNCCLPLIHNLVWVCAREGELFCLNGQKKRRKRKTFSLRSHCNSLQNLRRYLL